MTYKTNNTIETHIEKDGHYAHRFLGNGFCFCRICGKSREDGNHE